MKMNRKKGYIFTNKDHAKKGIMSTILGTISIVTLIFVIYFSYTYAGTDMVPERYATTVFLIMLFSLTGMVLGILGIAEKDRYKLFPRIGIILNVISLAVISLIMYAGAYGT